MIWKIYFHAAKALIISLGLCAVIFLPYMPGEHDAFAVAVSAAAQISAFVSILFIPLGAAWILLDLSAKPRGALKKLARIAGIAVLTLCVIAGVLAAAGGIGSFRGSALFAAVLIFIYAIVVFMKIIPKVKKTKNPKQNDVKTVSPIAAYMIIIPFVVMAARFAFIGSLAESARNTAVANAQPLVDDIETYYKNYGSYPESFQGLWKDYSTGVMGIEKYFYEPNGDAYNLFFESFSPDLAAREIVMYNKLDEHIIRSHPGFMFSLRREEFERYRGYLAEFDTPVEHWKYFLFD